jgi:hypothetical protein
MNNLFVLNNNNLIELNTNSIILNFPLKSNALLSNDINNYNIIIESYGGDLLTLFNYNNSWYSIIDNNIINNLPIELNDIIQELNIDYYYLFMLNNNRLIKKNNKYNLIYIKQKYLFNEIINENIKINKQKNLHFSSIDEINIYLTNISLNNSKSLKLTIDGLLLFNNISYINIQTNCYKNIIKLKPMHNNIHIGYLELYQKNLLLNYLPFDTDNSNDVLKRINISLKTISEEILNLYNFIINNINFDINLLPPIYSFVISNLNKFTLHNKYPTNINIHVVYYYIKNLNINQIIDIYTNRKILTQNILFNNFINKNCIYTKAQVYLLSK